jgi:hypothetical protein
MWLSRVLYQSTNILALGFTDLMVNVEERRSIRRGRQRDRATTCESRNDDPHSAPVRGGLIIGDCAPGCTLEVIVLTVPERPEKPGQTEKTEQKRQRHQEYQDFHQRASLLP